MDSPFEKYYEGEWVQEDHEPRCSEGYHCFKKHITKNGTVVEGHSAKNAFGSKQKLRSFVKEVYTESKMRRR